MKYYINTDELREFIPKLCVGDEVFLSGTVYCARDAAHKRIVNLKKKKKTLPFSIKNAVIYYCGPTPARLGKVIGSAGPTTSSRMDVFMPVLLKNGLAATIGKGGRSTETEKEMLKYGAIYFAAIGGAGAIAAKCIKSCEVIAFPELGCESVKKMEFSDFPLIVGNDIHGNSLFNK